jgi:HKD family nuclease
MPAALTVCRTSRETLAALNNICSWAHEILLAYAWASSRGGLSEHWRALPLKKVRQAVIGTQFAQTEPLLVRKLWRTCGDALKIIPETSDLFHPKVLVGLRNGLAQVLIGSSNFTHGGFIGNIELNLWLRGPTNESSIARIVSFVNDQSRHPRARTPDEAWLKSYERLYARRPKPPRMTRKTVGNGRVQSPLASVSDLNLEWPEYFALIARQEQKLRRAKSPIHIFDHSGPEGSYLQEIDACQLSFRRFGAMSAMPFAARSRVAGIGKETTRHLGYTGAAGRFRRLMRVSPGQVSDALDEIPSTGVVDDKRIVRFVETLRGLRGVGLGVASRLLAVKRPDMFISVNNASRRRIAAIFGRSPSTPQGYLDLVHEIWSLPWYLTPPPRDLLERRVWRYRVALLDAVMYDMI